MPHTSYRTAVDAAAIFSETDVHGRITYANEQFCRVSGYSHDELVGQDHRILNSGIHPPAFFREMWSCISSGEVWKGEVCNRAKDGSLYWVSSTIIPLLDEQGGILKYMSVRFDVTDRNRLLETLQWQVSRDALTGLLNRHSITRELERMIEQSRASGRPFAVAALDLDGFRALNEVHGSSVGDQLLIKVADRLSGYLRKTDMIARTGNDEFLLLLTGVAAEHELRMQLHGLLMSLAAPYEVNGQFIELTGCLGATTFPSDATDAGMLVRHADQALYIAKQEGQSAFQLFNIAEDLELRTRLSTLARVRHALADGELRLYYQPKVNLLSGEIVGYEALLRWLDPQQGPVPPGAFLPLVEQDDLIVDIGEWCIAEALRQGAEWRRAGCDWPISVNIAARHFQRADFASRLAELLAAQGDYPAWSLDLEIVESVAMHNFQQVSRSLSECRALGVSFSLDDFGTGYSSLSYLKRLPTQTIKVDQSFVRTLASDPDDLTLTGAIINLARSFKRSVVAEGVETTEQVRILAGLGCEVVQGYLLARPMPGEAVLGWSDGFSLPPLESRASVA